MLKPVKDHFEKTVTALKKVSLPTWGLILFPFLLWLVIEAPRWQASRVTLTDPEKYFEVENKARTTIVQAVGGLFLFMTAFAALRNAKATEDNRKIAEDKQVTERFVKAVEMLADKDRLEVRLGGIYSLERIAIDSPKDQWAIAEVLAAYVRANASVKESERYNTIPRYFEDIRAAFSAIGLKQAPDGKHIDLTNTELRGVNFENAKLNGAWLVEVNLWGAYLPHANLINAKLWNANLMAVDLQNAKLQNAHLRDVRLDYSNLANADLTGAILLEANLFDTNLRGCSKYLTREQIENAKNYREAIYDLDFAKKLGLDLAEQIRKAEEWDEVHKDQ